MCGDLHGERAVLVRTLLRLRNHLGGLRLRLEQALDAVMCHLDPSEFSGQEPAQECVSSPEVRRMRRRRQWRRKKPGDVGLLKRRALELVSRCAPSGVSLVDKAGIDALGSGIVLVDCRTAAEHAVSMIPNAVSRDEFERMGSAEAALLAGCCVVLCARAQAAVWRARPGGAQ